MESITETIPDVQHAGVCVYNFGIRGYTTVIFRPGNPPLIYYFRHGSTYPRYENTFSWSLCGTGSNTRANTLLCYFFVFLPRSVCGFDATRS